ncbi:TP901 family phage tail tape measure protein [Pedobacter sp. AK013]|uniref:phage tail tape measure protein n=1 Tax=Pedobacter sp. AK013 TaxID=2723071 RepID=UPI001615912F|nr:phage tail tape measure protein [Pedobacter sp. AK013]MBB6236490.1 TP901 family phage tail tape measure protein [Pedobacter sp. AK013]
MAATLSALRVPTVFTAVDRFSSIVSRMARGANSFANGIANGVARANRTLRRFTPTLSSGGRQLLEYAKTAVAASTIIAGIAFSSQSLMAYETQLKSFKTIVSDLSDKEFSKFSDKIGEIAIKSKGLASTVDVASSFEKIAGLNSKFAETADGLGLVSKAAITLSQASGDELGTSAENLVGIMNQFNLGADQANRVINVLAAGQAVGAASITQASESYKNFGAVAKGANITLEQSIGLIQTLAAKNMKGAEAGTALRGAIMRLQKAGAGYKSGQFQINDALDQVLKKTNQLTTAKKKDHLIAQVFGADNITAGKILLDNINLYKEFTKGVTGTSEAQKAASINSDTLSKKIDQVKNSWINYITTSKDATGGLEKIKKVLDFVINNFSEIINTILKVIGVFVAFKAILLATEIALFAWNVIMGIAAVRSATLAVSIGGGNVAMYAQRIATYAVIAAQYVWQGVLKAVIAAQWLWNAAMTANPIGLIIIGIAALITLIVFVIKKWDEWGAAVSIFMGPLGLVISLIQSFRRNWEMVTKAFKEGGILAGLKAIGKVIFDAVLQPVEQLLGLIGKFTGAKWASNAAASLHGFRSTLGVSMEGNNPEENKKPVLSTPQMKSDQITRETVQRNILDVNFNDPNNKVESTKMRGTLGIPIKINNTQGVN